jgi:hypothetical protein
MRKPKTVTTPKPLAGARLSAFIFRPGLRPALLAAVLCLTGLSAAAASAQRDSHEKDYALIYGTVWSPEGLPVYGVKVKIRRADQKKAKWELYSDHQGEFAQRVPPGPADYVVWADLKGFKSLDKRHLQAGDEVKVHISNDERQDIGVHLK